MNCNQFEKYLQQEISDNDFDNHMQICPECQASFEVDDKIMEMAATLDDNRVVPDLWPAIAGQISTPQKKSGKSYFTGNYLKIAAALLFLSSLALYLLMPRENESSPILNAHALQKVEQTELAYVHAIEELEKSALPKMDDLELNLALLYRDKLETINAQIERCRDALQTNPANTHIRRYLLAALDDKKQTLKDMVRDI